MKPNDKTDWSEAKPAHIPRPTVWPAGLAFGTSFLLWGLITSPVLLGVGLTLFVVCLAGWIGEFGHEQG